MKSEDVPQDNSEMLGGHKKALYGMTKDKKFTTVTTTGWAVEELVNSQAVEDLDRLTAEALSQMKKGEASPILYYMYKNRMDVLTLAQYVGCFPWTIKRHFKPDVFRKLPVKKLEKYAEVFSVDIKDLQQ